MKGNDALDELLVSNIDALNSEDVSDKTFSEYLGNGRPLKIKNEAVNWNAVDKWTPEWFADNYSDYVVPIANGSRRNMEYSSITISNFVAQMKNDQKQMYLRQYDIFTRIPELLNDIIIPRFCPNDRLVVPFFWMGCNTIQPLHQDHHSDWDGVANLFTQVFGRKIVVLADNTQTKYLYKRSNAKTDYHLSEVDIDNPNFENYPLLKYARFLITEVEAGDTLLIPSRYWHFVKSIGSSISVSCWWRPNKIADLIVRIGLLKGNKEKVIKFVNENRGRINLGDAQELGIKNLVSMLKSMDASKKLIFLKLFDENSKRILGE